MSQSPEVEEARLCRFGDVRLHAQLDVQLDTKIADHRRWCLTFTALTDDGGLRSAVADPNHIISVFSGSSCSRLAQHQAVTSAMQC